MHVPRCSALFMLPSHHTSNKKTNRANPSPRAKRQPASGGLPGGGVALARLAADAHLHGRVEHGHHLPAGQEGGQREGNRRGGLKESWLRMVGNPFGVGSTKKLAS